MQAVRTLDGADHRGRLVAHLLLLGLGHRVGHDPGPGLDIATPPEITAVLIAMAMSEFPAKSK